MLSLICCYGVTAFLNLLLKDRRVQKSIENARKRVLDAVNRVLFSKTVSTR